MGFERPIPELSKKSGFQSHAKHFYLEDAVMKLC
jgi:hypothetical protein